MKKRISLKKGSTGGSSCTLTKRDLKIYAPPVQEDIKGIENEKQGWKIMEKWGRSEGEENNLRTKGSWELVEEGLCHGDVKNWGLEEQKVFQVVGKKPFQKRGVWEEKGLTCQKETGGNSRDEMAYLSERKMERQGTSELWKCPSVWKSGQHFSRVFWGEQISAGIGLL